MSLSPKREAIPLSLKILLYFYASQNQSTNVIMIRALADSVLEGDEHFSIHLFPAQSGAVIDPLNGESF